MAFVPNNVILESAVAGKGPPETMEWHTSTPVRYSLISNLPTFRSNVFMSSILFSK